MAPKAKTEKTNNDFLFWVVLVGSLILVGVIVHFWLELIETGTGGPQRQMTTFQINRGQLSEYPEIQEDINDYCISWHDKITIECTRESYIGKETYCAKTLDDNVFGSPCRDRTRKVSKWRIIPGTCKFISHSHVNYRAVSPTSDWRDSNITDIAIILLKDGRYSSLTCEYIRGEVCHLNQPAYERDMRYYRLRDNNACPIKELISTHTEYINYIN